MSFNDKVVIITGAASGIGAATALRFAQLSAQLALVDKDEQGLKKSQALCEESGGRKHLAIVADLSSTEQLLTIVPKTIERYGKIDVLANVAGIYIGINIASDDLAEVYDKVMAVNLKAPVILTNKVAPYLVKSKGNIVNISSIASTRCGYNRSIYCVSKAALEMFTKCTAVELAGQGVRANSVHPGLVRTNILRGSVENVEEMYESYSKHRRVIEPEEVAKLITFLASDDAKSINGSSYVIDCGYSIIPRK